jgi:hypothetical protein
VIGRQEVRAVEECIVVGCCPEVVEVVEENPESLARAWSQVVAGGGFYRR